MKRLVLAGAACVAPALRRRGWIWNTTRRRRRTIKSPRSTRKTRALRHKVWNVDNLTLANEQAIAREQQREAARSAKRQQHHLEQQQKKQRCLRRHSKDPHREAKCYMHNF